jgi:DnaK suppressor protein
MFASIFQLMGFPMAKPVHSRAEENRSETASLVVPPDSQKQTTKAIAPVQPEQKMPMRSPSVKAPASKSKAKPSGKPAPAVAKSAKSGKVEPPAKAVKVAVPAKPLAKTLVKPLPGKVAVATKAKVKPAAVSGKPKPVAKVAAPAGKPAAAAKAAKSTKVATPARPVSAPKTVVKAAPVKAKAAQASAKPSPVNPTKSSDTVSQVSPKTTKAAPAAPTPIKAAANEPVVTSSGVPVRSGRPSSRLAQLTVPSMAQSVASTAAKASFTKMTAVQPIISPLASATKRNPKLANNWKTKAVTELTDQEIIAMPDDAYMNDTQMAFFRLKLVTLKDDILSSAGQTTEHLREDTVVVPDPADRATIEEEHALELRTRDRERKLLKKIEQSIDRIDAGDYGYCDETGEPIGVGRLLARPTATLSLEAQQRRELKQKMFGD